MSVDVDQVFRLLHVSVLVCILGLPPSFEPVVEECIGKNAEQDDHRPSVGYLLVFALYAPAEVLGPGAFATLELDSECPAFAPLRVLSGTASWAGVSARVVEMRRRAELVLLLHLVVAILQELVVA